MPRADVLNETAGPDRGPGHYLLGMVTAPEQFVTIEKEAGPIGVLFDDPRAVLALAEWNAKVWVIGPVSGPGWTGTRYGFRGLTGTHAGVGTEFSGTADVDAQGRLRRLHEVEVARTPNFSITSTSDIAYSDFGTPVSVSPPSGPVHAFG